MKPLTLREQKAVNIASHLKPIQHNNTWLVPSSSGTKYYIVTPSPAGMTCTCLDYEARQSACKHVLAVQYVTDGVPFSNQQIEESNPKRPTYPQNWPAYNCAQVVEKSKFQSLLHALCAGIQEPPQENGRPRMLLRDMIFAAIFKVYSTVSSRRFSSDMREAHQKHYITEPPHFNVISSYLRMDSLTPYLKQMIAESATPLRVIETDFAVDSSGFRLTKYDRWMEDKYGMEVVKRKRSWLKCHLMCGVKTNIVTAAEVTDKDTGDSPYFAPMVNATAQKGFHLVEVSADKGYSSNDNLKLVTQKGGTPYIAFKEGSTVTKQSNDTWKRMFHFYSLNRDEFLAHYHKRSNVESTFHMIKSKFGETIRSKSERGQTNEALCKIIAHNIVVVIHSIYELGIQPTFWQD